jgi:lysophospholipase L1-like esterase
MPKIVTVLILVVVVVAGANGQSFQQPLIPPHALSVNVVLFGHSWIYLMNGYQPWAFPNIPSNHVAVQGYYGYTCAQLLPLVSSSVPASTNAVFIMAATNDVAQGVPVATHIACMKNMVEQLIAENAHMLILLSNDPPFCLSTLPLFGDKRSVIAAYNQAYATLPQLYPNNVQVVDMWTPMVDTSGWGLANMFLTDGAHFGPNGKDLVMGVIRDALYSELPR